MSPITHTSDAEEQIKKTAGSMFPTEVPAPEQAHFKYALHALEPLKTSTHSPFQEQSVQLDNETLQKKKKKPSLW